MATHPPERVARALAAALLAAGLGATILAGTFATPAVAAAPAAAPALAAADLHSLDGCPGGNLLASARLVDSLDVDGTFVSATDGFGGPEGGRVAYSQGVHFLTNAGSLTYDLGVDRPIAAALVQGDVGNTFSLQVSDDGRAFREIWLVPDVTAPGLRTRYGSFSDVHGRYVRFGESSGPGARGVSEVEVFCELPAAWPFPAPVAPPSPPRPPAPRTLQGFVRANDAAAKFLLACCGAAILLWGWRLAKAGAPLRHARVRNALLIACALLSYAAYYDWGYLHYGTRIHYHEFFHYYIGAKYFPELGYSHLYECASLAEAEDGFQRRVELRTIRNLKRNELVSARYVLEDPARLKAGFSRPFTAERWNAFKKDVGYFRDHMPIGRWENALRDHGYNPSPAWNMTASLLANIGPASPGLLEGFLALLDPALLLITFGFVFWAFGWRIACIALIFFGTNEPALFYWTGGAFLRQDWFAAAIVGICLLKKERYVLGGGALAVSTLLRVFPIGFFVAIGLRLVWILLRERRIDRVGARIVAGAAIVVALVVPLSSVVAGSASAWPEFWKNTRKHADSPLTNYMGLRTMVGFRWETRQKFTFNASAVDPFHDFREARKKAFRGLFGEPFFLALGAAYLGLLMWALRREKDWWVLAAFGFGVITMGMELTCYYYSFFMAAALLWEKRPSIAIGLLVLSALGHCVSWGTYYYDVRYFGMSAIAVAFVVWATWMYGRVARVEPAAAAVASPASSAP